MGLEFVILGCKLAQLPLVALCCLRVLSGFLQQYRFSSFIAPQTLGALRSWAAEQPGVAKLQHSSSIELALMCPTLPIYLRKNLYASALVFYLGNYKS